VPRSAPEREEHGRRREQGGSAGGNADYEGDRQ